MMASWLEQLMTTADEEVAWNARVKVEFNQFQLY
jgi:hypothetical protein